jgi:hypothetical protein
VAHSEREARDAAFDEVEAAARSSAHVRRRLPLVGVARPVADPMVAWGSGSAGAATAGTERWERTVSDVGRAKPSSGDGTPEERARRTIERMAMSDCNEVDLARDVLALIETSPARKPHSSSEDNARRERAERVLRVLNDHHGHTSFLNRLLARDVLALSEAKAAALSTAIRATEEALRLRAEVDRLRHVEEQLRIGEKVRDGMLRES